MSVPSTVQLLTVGRWMRYRMTMEKIIKAIVNKGFIVITGVLSIILLGMNAQSFAEKGEIDPNAWPTFTHPAYKFQFNYPPDYQILGVNRWGCWIIKKGESIDMHEDIQVRVEGFSLCKNQKELECGFKFKANQLAVSVCSTYNWKTNRSNNCKVNDVSEFKTISGLKGYKFQFELLLNDLSKEKSFLYVVDTTIGQNMGGLLYIIGGQNNLKINDDLIWKIIQSVSQAK